MKLACEKTGSTMVRSIAAKAFATPRQRAKIAQLCVALHIQERLEEQVTTSAEASAVIAQLCSRLKMRRSSLTSPQP